MRARGKHVEEAAVQMRTAPAGSRKPALATRENDRVSPPTPPLSGISHLDARRQAKLLFRIVSGQCSDHAYVSDCKAPVSLVTRTAAERTHEEERKQRIKCGASGRDRTPPTALWANNFAPLWQTTGHKTLASADRTDAKLLDAWECESFPRNSS